MTDNREIIRAAFQAWEDGTGGIADVFAPDMVWRIEGRSLVAGEYRSRQEFVDRVLAPFGRRFGPEGRFRPTEIRSILADGDTVVIAWAGRGTAIDGVAYENSYAWIMVMRGGLVVEGTAFFDSIAFNDLWTRVPV